MTFVNTLPSDGDLLEAQTPPKRYPAPLARSEGRVEIGYRLQGSESRLAHLYQRGCGRARFPTVDHAIYPEAVLINTAGGLTGGDHLSYDILLETGAYLTVSGQAAEKIYRSVGTTAIIEAHLRLEKGASLEWLPQETILFEKSRLARMNNVHLAAGSRLLALEATVFGRAAHGETLRSANIRDGWKIWRDGKLIWYDNFVLDGDIQRAIERPALLGGAKAVATILLADEDAEKYVSAARLAAFECGVRAAVTCRNGLLIMRVLGKNGYLLRKALAQILTALRSELAGHPVALPKVWENQ